MRRRNILNGLNYLNARNAFDHGGARIGNISPTACAEILPYEFYRVAPEGVTFVTTNLVIRDARESIQVEASWRKFDTAFEDLLYTRERKTGTGKFSQSGKVASPLAVRVRAFWLVRACGCEDRSRNRVFRGQ